MDAETRRQVRLRAGNRCEYCRLCESDSPLGLLQIEHICPRKHGGTDDEWNLALACIQCNLHKGSNLTGIDPQTGQIAELFNPRRQDWATHFATRGAAIVGLTPVGRATVRVLEMNARHQLRARRALRDALS
jgi:hypothetical protein